MRSQGTSQGPSGRRRRGTLLLEAIATAAVTLALLTPVDAQFWGNWGGSSSEQRRPPRPVPQQQQQLFNPFGGPGWFDNTPQQREPRAPQREREAPVDYSHAPPQQKKPDAAASTPVLVFGDGMADWLAYGLEDAFSEKPEISIVRKNRAAAGLIRYDTRRDTEWPQVVREAIAADKPKFIVMMIGVNDRQSIRERVAAAAATPARPGAARTAPPPAAAPAPPTDPNAGARERPAERGIAGRCRAAAGGRLSRVPCHLRHFDFHTEKPSISSVSMRPSRREKRQCAGVLSRPAGPAQRLRHSDPPIPTSSIVAALKRPGSPMWTWDGFVRPVVRGAGSRCRGPGPMTARGDGVYFTKAGAAGALCRARCCAASPTAPCRSRCRRRNRCRLRWLQARRPPARAARRRGRSLARSFR
jgi:hypothetical protein